ncbi:glycine betaine/L-proline ABC transporter ATP-binding protein [Candidatus Uabimicrobium sp. HlEnr_7]|uniref:quaternary amine ABC transporter ATP-binding protein n=1 Tax=Candidatus Uabimicrobium helgolandensis TaxID=3095367 RepID=UPI0035578A4B
MKIVCENLWKIFGAPTNVVSLLQNGQKDVHQISKFYTTAVNDVCLSINEGELFVVMGLSGSGKSTLLRCFNRLIEPTLGKIVIDGENIIDMEAKRLREVRQKKMGMVFQHFALLPHRSVIENVAFGLEVQNLDKKQRLTRAQQTLEIVGLKGWGSNYPNELSGGMKQRVGLARALALDPDIILMDEAFSALDPLVRCQMQDEFLQLVKQLNKTIIFITHDLDEALKLASRIAVMKDGKVIQVGTPQQIVLEPADDYVSEFVSSVSQTKVTVAKNIMSLDKVHIVKENITSYPTVDIDAPLKTVLTKITQTTTPLVVIDKNEEVAGVIDRDSLLQKLANMV